MTFLRVTYDNLAKKIFEEQRWTTCKKIRVCYVAISNSITEWAEKLKNIVMLEDKRKFDEIVKKGLFPKEAETEGVISKDLFLKEIEAEYDNFVANIKSKHFKNEYRFNIALSFAGEYRNIVAKIASGLANVYGEKRILYDKFFEAEFARPNLDIHLQKLYHSESRLIVIFLGNHYNQKSWCGLEWRSIRDLLNQQTHDERIMFVRVDDGEVNGIYGRVDGYITVNDGNIDKVTKLIIERYDISNNKTT